MPRALQHCGLLVGDLAASRRFYGDALGLDEVPRPSNFTFAGAWFRAGVDEVHLISADDTTGIPGLPEQGRAVHVGLTTHLAFEVESLDRSCARLAEHGVELAGGPMERGDGVEQVYVHDPDGYVVELFQVTGEQQADAPERAPMRE